MTERPDDRAYLKSRNFLENGMVYIKPDAKAASGFFMVAKLIRKIKKPLYKFSFSIYNKKHLRILRIPEYHFSYGNHRSLQGASSRNFIFILI
jgi:hypothetical protein